MSILPIGPKFARCMNDGRNLLARWHDVIFVGGTSDSCGPVVPVTQEYTGSVFRGSARSSLDEFDTILQTMAISANGKYLLTAIGPNNDVEILNAPDLSQLYTVTSTDSPIRAGIVLDDLTVYV